MGHSELRPRPRRLRRHERGRRLRGGTIFDLEDYNSESDDDFIPSNYANDDYEDFSEDNSDDIWHLGT